MVEEHLPARLLRVYIASDVRLYRDGIAASLLMREGMVVVGSGPCAGALVRAMPLSPDVMLMDHACGSATRGAWNAGLAPPAFKVIALANTDGDTPAPGATQDDQDASEADERLSSDTLSDPTLDELVESILRAAERVRAVRQPSQGAMRRLPAVNARSDGAVPIDSENGGSH